MKLKTLAPSLRAAGAREMGPLIKAAGLKGD